MFTTRLSIKAYPISFGLLSEIPIIARIDNKKFKTLFGLKAKMLTPEEVEKYTGHKIGGVCPFAIERDEIKIYLDTSLKRFENVYPACGSSNSAIKLTCEELEKLSNSSGWIDACQIVP